MICGLEAYQTDELPDGYAFTVLEASQPAMEQARKEAIEYFLSALYEKIKELAKEYGVDLD